MIRTYDLPNRIIWSELFKRPEIEKNDLTNIVEEIMQTVKQTGDLSLYKYSNTIDGVELSSICVSEEEFSNAIVDVSDELKTAINVARQNIEKFHRSQQIEELPIETTKGVTCWRRSVAIEKVGIYIPGGTAPLFSTILMLAIPAKIAGCKEIIMCTPPNKKGLIHPAILYTANLLGIKKIFKIGGAQAIAAMSYGTESVPNVYKIFGPGNQYVTRAKSIVQQEGVAIDMPAGPSELLVIADETCNPKFVAADLLSQAEHGIDSQVVLLSDSLNIVTSVQSELKKQLNLLTRKEICVKALSNSFAVILNDINECIDFSNAYAPEHLILATENALELSNKVINAGSVFIGNYSCESAGDYASGTNHTLPTNGFAKSYSGVSVDSFVKKITFQNLSKTGLQIIGPTVELLANTEELDAHRNAITIRLKSN